MDNNKECTIYTYTQLRAFLLPTQHAVEGHIHLGNDGPNCSCLVQIYHAVDQSPASGLYLPGQALDFPLELLILFS